MFSCVNGQFFLFYKFEINTEAKFTNNSFVFRLSFKDFGSDIELGGGSLYLETFSYRFRVNFTVQKETTADCRNGLFTIFTVFHLIILH